MHRRQRVLIAMVCMALEASVAMASGDEPAPAPPTPGSEPAPPAPSGTESAPPSHARAEAGAASTEPATGAVGTVTGHALDGDTQVGLAAATVQVLGSGGGGSGTTTELDGAYTLRLRPGTYTLVFSTDEYAAAKRIITVAEAQTLTVDVALSVAQRPDAAETIEIYSTVDDRKDSAVLAQRRTSATVSDAISAQQISRSPDSNASDAAKRMVAATIQDNRYIVVRGLGGRYSTTLLNGVPLPSPDPDVPAAPLDLFPAALITNLTINKTFAPDMPGNFAGGALGIETRVYPTRFLFKARVGAAGNSESSFRTLNGQHGGSLDPFGYDDGTRALPEGIPRNQTAGGPSLTIDQRNAQAAAFTPNWSIDRAMAGPNLSAGATLGDTVKLADQRLGYFASASFSHGYASRKIHLARAGEPDGNGGRLPSALQLDDQEDVAQSNLGAVASAGWTPAQRQKLDLFALYSHTADSSASQVVGTTDSTAVVDRTNLRFLQRELAFTQLVGDNRLSSRAFLEWQAHVARVAQDEPDTRDLVRTRTAENQYSIDTSPGSSERIFGGLADTTVGGAAALRVPLDGLKLKLGGAVQRSAREYQVRRFHFTLTDGAELPPDEAFAADRAGSGMGMRELTAPEDGYTATRSVLAGYAMADVQPTPALRLVGGVRLEHSSLDLSFDSKVEQDQPPMLVTERAHDDVLPSLNAVYAVTPSTNLRAAYAITVARPNFREVAPAVYYDYVRDRTISGNSALEDTRIHNGDLRWETFLGDSEVLAASVFAKYFAKPIERTVSYSGEGDRIGFQNSDSATVYGAELEARVSLGRLTTVLSPLSFGGNVSLLRSRIDINGATEKRALQGQSPFVVNLALGYENAAVGTRVDLAYNTFGRRLDELGAGGAPDIYEEPLHRLDLTISQPLPRNLLLKLAGSNLLDQRVVRRQDGVEVFAYPVGVTVLGSVEYSLE